MQEIKQIKVIIPLFEYIKVYDTDTTIVIYTKGSNDTFNIQEILNANQILLKERQSGEYTISINSNDNKHYISTFMVRSIDLPKETYTQQELPFKLNHESI